MATSFSKQGGIWQSPVNLSFYNHWGLELCNAIITNLKADIKVKLQIIVAS